MTVQAVLARAIRGAGGDAATLFGEPLRAVRDGEWRRYWFGIVSPVLVLALWLAFRTPGGHAFVRDWGIMRAGDPWPETVARLPLSLFAPAHLLPAWTAMIQVAVVFGAAQVLLGARRTLALGLGGHILGTLSGRLWVWLGPPVGLTPHWLHFADAGPSVAAVSLGAYLMVRYRLPWLAGALLIFHVGEWITVDGLSQREHVVGVLVGSSAAAVGAWRRYRRARPQPAVTGEDTRCGARAEARRPA
ncbi:MAG TPA: hypothetical protein VGD11_05445 [Mycobacteriales bacterium]|jgi:hypothetical protein